MALAGPPVGRREMFRGSGQSHGRIATIHEHFIAVECALPDEAIEIVAAWQPLPHWSNSP